MCYQPQSRINRKEAGYAIHVVNSIHENYANNITHIYTNTLNAGYTGHEGLQVMLIINLMTFIEIMQGMQFI